MWRYHEKFSKNKVDDTYKLIIVVQHVERQGHIAVADNAQFTNFIDGIAFTTKMSTSIKSFIIISVRFSESYYRPPKLSKHSQIYIFK